MTILYLILGILGFYYSFKLLYMVGCMFLLSPNHPRNLAIDEWIRKNTSD